MKNKIFLAFAAGVLVSIVINQIGKAIEPTLEEVLVADYQLPCFQNILKHHGKIHKVQKIRFPEYLSNSSIVAFELNQEWPSLDYRFGVCIGNAQSRVSVDSKNIDKTIAYFKSLHGQDILIYQSADRKDLVLYSTVPVR